MLVLVYFPVCLVRIHPIAASQGLAHAGKYSEADYYLQASCQEAMPRATVHAAQHLMHTVTIKTLKEMQVLLTGEGDVTRSRIFDSRSEILVPEVCDCEFQHRNHTRYRDRAFRTEAVAVVLIFFGSTHM